MTPKDIKISVGELCGWRRWMFGDPWVKGLRLADQRFDGYVRRVIEDAHPDSEIVRLDIPDLSEQKSDKIRRDYIPVSHWVKGNLIRSTLPNYTNDLNAMQEAWLIMGRDQQILFWRYLSLGVSDRCLDLLEHDLSMIANATAMQRAVAFLKVHGKLD